MDCKREDKDFNPLTRVLMQLDKEVRESDLESVLQRMNVDLNSVMSMAMYRSARFDNGKPVQIANLTAHWAEGFVAGVRFATQPVVDEATNCHNRSGIDQDLPQP